MYLLCINLVNEYYNISTETMVTCVLYNIKISFCNQFWICISIRSTPCNWTADDPIFALLHLLYAKNALIFFNLLYLFCVKLFSPSEIMFTNDEHGFLRILVTNLRVLCFDIYAIPTMCTPYYQSRLNLVSEIRLLNILTWSAWGVTVSFSRNN